VFAGILLSRAKELRELQIGSGYTYNVFMLWRLVIPYGCYSNRILKAQSIEPELGGGRRGRCGERSTWQHWSETDGMFVFEGFFSG